MRSSPDVHLWTSSTEVAGFTVTAGSIIGPARMRNDDVVLADASRRLVILTDGMGGNAEALLASEIAADALCAHARDGLTAAFAWANEAVSAAAAEKPERRGMGAVAVAAVLDAGGATIAHLGDARAYRQRGGHLTALTRDHDLARAMREQGHDPATVQQDLRHTVVTRALGMPGSEPDITTVALEPGDRLILCTDGVHGALADASLANLLAMPDTLTAIRVVLEAAAASESGENASLVIVAAA